MANTANLRCIRKNIGYVCADGFWSSAEILENSLVLAKMQILQNARWVWLRADVCNSLLDRFGNCRIPIISGFIWKRTQTTQTRAESPQQRVALARSTRELLPQPLWSCPDRLPSLRFRGFSNPFLKIRGAEPRLRRGAARGGNILILHKHESLSLFPDASKSP